MPIAFDCPRCKSKLSLPASPPGTLAVCPWCKAHVPMPEAGPEEAASAAARTQETQVAPELGAAPASSPARAPTLIDAPIALAAEVEKAKTDPKRAFGRFLLLGELGKGGMGVVYRAFDQKLKRAVALKMILPGADSSADLVRRFYREAEAVARLRHPNIVTVHEAGESSGKHYLAMDFIEGSTLATRLKGKLSLRESATLLRDVARAVHHAHQQGVVHRDLKPANIMIDREGTPFVLDFGLASLGDGRTRITKTGAGVGTPAYMSPEQADGGTDGAVDHRSDVYSLGATLYHAITGKPPFEAESDFKVLAALLTREPSRPSAINPETAGDLETICLRCLAKDRTKRYPTAAALANDLDRFVAGEEIIAQEVSSLERLGVSARKNKAVVALGSATVVLSFACAVLAVYAFSQGKTPDAEAHLPGVDQKKPDEKKPDEKKPDEKKPDEKKPDEKKPEEKIATKEDGKPVASQESEASAANQPEAPIAPVATPENAAAESKPPEKTGNGKDRPAPPRVGPTPGTPENPGAPPDSPPRPKVAGASPWRRLEGPASREKLTSLVLHFDPSDRAATSPVPLLAFGPETELSELGPNGWASIASKEKVGRVRPAALAVVGKVFIAVGENWVKRSENAGKRWADVKAPDGSCFSVAYDSTIPATYVGLGDTVARLGSGEWEYGPRGHYPMTGVVVDPKGTAYCVCLDRIFKITPSSGKWEPVPVLKVSEKFPGNETYTIAIDAKSPQTLYAGSKKGVLKTTDAGSNWDQVGTLTTPIISLAVDVWTGAGPKAGPSSIIYAGGTKGQLQKSIDAGLTWHPIDLGLPERAVKSIVVDPLNPRLVSVLIEGEGVFQTTTGGSAWINMQPGGMPDGIDRLVYDKTKQVAYAFGGADGRHMDRGHFWNDLWRFDPKSRKWTETI
ncbi:protein kinase, partial [bacterium]|nr:protein kinase [bacterium]